ncbi:hypothetical protein LPJ60_003035 [Coemansia sp. RSA 2675]|nr:hypothetical protein LPJ60_003035 [Coemansia sp. RSA 2675]
MTFVDDIDLLLPILSADNSCRDNNSYGAGLDGLKLGTIFGTAAAPPPSQPHTQCAQLDAVFSIDDGSKPSHTAQPAVERPPSQAMKNVDPISIQYTEKEKRERKYECQYCHKRFSRPSSLTSHVYTHTGERPFACDFLGCTKRFSVLSNLRRHYKVHSSRRAYGGARPQSTSFHSSIYASAIPGRGCSFGASAAGFAEPNRPMPPASFALLQEHPAMRSDYSMLAPGSRELFSSSMALQPRSGSVTKTADFPSFGASGYAPSIRTTASALSLPESLEASLLGGLSGEQLAAAAAATSGYQGPLLAGPNSSSSNSSSPTSNQALCIANLGLTSSDGHVPAPIDSGFAPTSQFDAAITDSQFAAIFGRMPTEHKFGNSDTSGAGCSDSDNSSDHVPTAADARLLPLGGQGYRAASPDTLDVLIKATTVGSKMSDPLSEFFPRSPRIATQSILTNTSVTTKAMNGAIDPVGSASQDLAMLFSLDSTKSAPLGLVDLPLPHRQQSLLQANGPSFMPTGAKLLGGIGGMAASHAFAESGAVDSGINDAMWRVLHTGHSHDS